MNKTNLTIPNLLTLLRILLIPVFVWAILDLNFTLALIVFFIAGISDGFDGFLARRLNQQSQLGQWLDPIADKLLLTITCLVLTLPDKGYQPLPIWLTIAIIIRDVGILIVALSIRHLTGFSDFKPSKPGKLNTVLLLVTVLAFLITNSIKRYTEYLIGFYWLDLVMIIFSGLHYIYFVNQELIAYRQTQRG
ncbi:MAG: CDP-diacylglycerol--glycerol-3-phosphate 3-phosphatidyltransferase [bacterium]|nr:MAG: CDP-diacylglycerol--glycerol-3-phosphate 3-phosphatidyltransferase [bacterium]